jgi:endonuclease/exonuclease/phosphatase family metal-dependent hydrolase
MRLRVVTLNVWNNQGDPRRNGIINRELQRLDPDLVSLREVMAAPAHNQLETLLRGLDLHSTHQAEVLATQPAHSDRYGGSVIASRWPYRFVEVLDLNKSASQDVPWRTLAVLVPIPGEGELLFIGTTFSWRLNAGPAARNPCTGSPTAILRFLYGRPVRRSEANPCDLARRIRPRLHASRSSQGRT